MLLRLYAICICLGITAAKAQSTGPDLGLFSIGDQGAVGDSKVGYNCSVPAGTNSTLVCSDPNISFAASDIGHTVWIYGSNSSQYYVATPGITIASVTNSQTVVLAGSLSRSVTNGMIQVVGTTDNSAAIQNTITLACSTATASNPATVFTPAGVYGFTATPTIPAGCSNIKLQASGKAIWLNTAIVSNTPGGHGYGQGTEALIIGGNSHYTLQNTGASIAAGSNQLTCSGCSLSSASVGQPIYVQSAGPDGLPLWSTITAVAGNVATLASNAQTTMSPSNLGGPLVTWGYQLTRNIEISGMEFQNVGYYYNPTNAYVSMEGLPVLLSQLGSVLQGFYFHDSVITTATNSCFRGDGVSDQFNYDNITCHGSTDVAMSFYGSQSNGTVKHPVVDNTQWPLPNTWVVNAYTIKGASHVTFENPVARCNCYSYIFNQSDIPAFNVTISDADFDAEGSAAIGIASALSDGFLVDGGQIRNATSPAFLFYAEVANGVRNLAVRGVTGTNVLSALTVSDYSGTGHGVKNIVFEANEFHTTGGNGANVGNVEGVNFWRQNSFFGNGSATAAWVLSSSGVSGDLNVFSDNFDSGYMASNLFDASLVQGTLQNYYSATAPVIGGLVKPSTASNQAVAPLALSDTAGAIGVAVSSSSSRGNVMVQEDGPTEVITDGDTRLGDQVTYSSIVAGAVHDTGSSTLPPQPMAVVGTVSGMSTHVSISSLTTDTNSLMTVSTASAHKLISGEPFTITGAIFNGIGLNVAGVVASVLSTTSFTFQSNASPSQTGTGGQVNPPAQINLRPVDPVTVAGGKTSLILTGQYASIAPRTVLTNGASTGNYFIAAEVAQDSSVMCSTYGNVVLSLAWHELNGNIGSASVTYRFSPTLTGSGSTQRLGPYGVLVPANGTIYFATSYTPGTGCSGNGSTYTAAVQVQ